MSTEFELIEAFLKPFPSGRAVRIGPGSDCAAVSVSPGMQLVATTDAIVEGVHFDLRRFSPEDVGWKALAVNLSDLAAAGARPRWLNVTRASEWSVTITALGEARRPLSRDGARPGDALAVVGSLGDAAAGLRPDPAPAAARAQRRPKPLVREGLLAARYASAAIDVSDGFLQDLGHLCNESGVGAIVECTSLPLGSAARRLRDGLDLALSGGEDYALLLSIPRRNLQALRKRIRLAEVGRMVRGRDIQLTELGQPRPLPRRTGFDHLE